MGARVVKTYPKPHCPECGAQMKLRRPKKNDTWEMFWGCSCYPDCSGSRDILPDGRPYMFEEEYG